jgi:hypothetical protein
MTMARQRDTELRRGREQGRHQRLELVRYQIVSKGSSWPGILPDPPQRRNDVLAC